VHKRLLFSFAVDRQLLGYFLCKPLLLIFEDQIRACIKASRQRRLIAIYHGISRMSNLLFIMVCLSLRNATQRNTQPLIVLNDGACAQGARQYTILNAFNR
jgi:hypothetical protein